MRRTAYYFTNAITFYRLLAAPFLMYLVWNGNADLFKWVLPISFFSDLLDGFVARKFNVTSPLGSRIDSLADDLTILAATIAVLKFKFYFISENKEVISFMLLLFLFQLIYSLLKFRKISSFHTYMAKAAALLQGSFLIFLFLLPQPLYWLFHFAAIATILDLIEEIILVRLLPHYEINVKGIYWIFAKRRNI
jgi:cardiolipin synthase